MGNFTDRAVHAYISSVGDATDQTLGSECLPGLSHLRLWAAYLIGSLFLVSAGLKLHHGLHDMLYFSDWGWENLLQPLIAWGLTTVSFFLLRNSGVRFTWAIVSAVMMILFGVSIVNSISGVKDCGCFGVVSMAPSVIALLDGLLLLLSLVLLFNTRGKIELLFSPALSCVLESLLVVSLVAIIMIFALLVNQNNSTLIAPVKPIIGTPVEGRPGWFTLKLPIKSPEALTIVGAEASCGYQIGEVLPLSTKSQLDIKLFVRLPDGATLWKGSMLLYIKKDGFKKRRLNFSVMTK